MYAQVKNTKDNKSSAIANTIAQKKSYMKPSFGFVDNRSKTVFQRKLKTQMLQLMSNQLNLGVIQRAPTSIQYDTNLFDMENGKKEIVGHKMIANINPMDKVKGSAPGSGVQVELMQEFKNIGYKRMIRGHLMNGQLGGLGIAANLFPITSQANSKHKLHVENPIKDQVKKGKEIQYTVTVQSQNKMSNPNANFVCRALATDKSWSTNETITSTPGQSTTRGRNVEGYTNMGTNSMSFKTANLPSGYGQKDKGYTANSDHQKTLNKSSFSMNNCKIDVNDCIYGRGYHFETGTIDRQTYALELIEDYNEDQNNKWPIYFDKKPYMSQDLEDIIDSAKADDVERIISELEKLL